MPYIKQNDRAKFEMLTDFMEDSNIPTTGDLNYLITKLIISYLKQHGMRYSTCNDIVGALESCKAEFQRRVVGPYEDVKIDENGEVYGL